MCEVMMFDGNYFFHILKKMCKHWTQLYYLSIEGWFFKRAFIPSLIKSWYLEQPTVWLLMSDKRTCQRTDEINKSIKYSRSTLYSDSELKHHCSRTVWCRPHSTLQSTFKNRKLQNGTPVSSQILQVRVNRFWSVWQEHCV